MTRVSARPTPLSTTPRQPDSPSPPLLRSFTADVPDTRLVSRNFLAALNIPVIEGRGFSEQEGLGAPRAMLINRTLAGSAFVGDTAIGNRFYTLGLGAEPWEVVGIVEDVRQASLRQSHPPRRSFSLPANSPIGTTRWCRILLRSTCRRCLRRDNDRDPTHRPRARPSIDGGLRRTDGRARVQLGRASAPLCCPARHFCGGGAGAGDDRHIRRGFVCGDAANAGDWRAHCAWRHQRSSGEARAAAECCLDRRGRCHRAWRAQPRSPGSSINGSSD